MNACADRYDCLQQALRLIKNQPSPRHTDIDCKKGIQIEAEGNERNYQGDFTTISRNVHEAERKLKSGVKTHGLL